MTLLANARSAMLQTRHALNRIDVGTYGICESCGNPIGKLRLQAFPRATLCVSCAAAGAALSTSPGCRTAPGVAGCQHDGRASTGAGDRAATSAASPSRTRMAAGLARDSDHRVIVLDQVAKISVVHALTPGQPVPVVDGLVKLTLTRNAGAAFSMATADDVAVHA